MKKLSPTVIFLGLASFFTDCSSEMIYPLLPVFLSSVLGAGALALGVIEGVAESTASLLKVASGVWTDRTRRRKPLMLAGYGLAGLARPLIGLAGAWPFVLAMRVLDRIGKGLRTSPRDALIADVTDPDMRGTAYGVHRAMDHAGAVVGPLLAAGLLALFAWLWPTAGADRHLRWVFLLAAVPAVAVMVILVFGVREPPAHADAESPRANFKALWSGTDRNFKTFLLAVLVFTLGNSTDAFLLLRLKSAGISAAGVAVLWALHHVVKMALTYVGGRLADRMGRRTMIVMGWAVYAAVYLAFALVSSKAGLIAIFLAYGIYFGLCEPAEKALVSDLAPKPLRGTAFGCYHGVIGLAALPASLLFGLLWQQFGMTTAFATGAGLAALGSVLLMATKSGRTVLISHEGPA